MVTNDEKDGKLRPREGTSVSFVISKTVITLILHSIAPICS
jgi:hypothetical protein